MPELFPAQPDSSASNVAETPATPAAAGSLVKKLAEACDAVGGVEKRGRNEKQNYAYVKAADVAKAFRHELFSRGLVVIPNERAFEEIGRIKTSSGGELVHWKLTVDYIIRDSDSPEQIIITAFGTGMDSGDKAIYKCKTGAVKYFLRGLGLIPDEKDDPEITSPEDDAKYEKDFESRTADQRLVGDYQIRAWESGKKQGVRTEAQITAYFKTLGIAAIEDMPKSVFNDAIKWLLNPKVQDLAKELTESVKAVAPKPVKALNFAALFATAKEKGVPEADVKQYSYETFGIKSMTELTPLQFKEVQDWIGTLA